MREFKPWVFEIPLGQTKYGRREFVGYSGDRLITLQEGCNPYNPPFHTFATFGPTAEAAFESLNAVLKNYIEGTVGHIHWRFGPQARQLRDGEWQASASLVVNNYLPPLGPREF